MRIFRRSSSEQLETTPEVPAKVEFPKIASANDLLFTEQHYELDALEERLANLQTPTLPPIEDRTIEDGIAPSAGRVNEIDLRHVMALGNDDHDEEDADFERRFNAFANHSDLGAPSWAD